MTTTDIIASLALVVSLVSLVASYRTAQLDSVKLRAWCTFRAVDEYNEHPYITVSIVNEGRRTAILRILGGDYAGGASGTYLDGEKGMRLGESEIYEKHMGFAELSQNGPENEDEFTNLWFKDSLGKKHVVKGSEDAIRKYKAAS